ncbi:MAG: hypothetical protein QW728_00620, partial [Thermoplasmata archaeon]
SYNLSLIVLSINDCPLYGVNGTRFADVYLYEGSVWVVALDDYFWDVEYDLELSFAVSSPNITIDPVTRTAYWRASKDTGNELNVTFFAYDFEDERLFAKSENISFYVISSDPAQASSICWGWILILLLLILAVFVFIYRRLNHKDEEEDLTAPGVDENKEKIDEGKEKKEEKKEEKLKSKEEGLETSA